MNKLWGPYGWVLAAAAVLAVYANSLDGEYHYDDEHSLLNNANIRVLANIPAFFGPQGPQYFSVDPDKGMYRPLLLSSYALNFAWHGFEVRGYHWVNILLHAANAALVWYLARVMGLGTGRALVAGLLFAVHPLASEPVNYLSSRSESLVALGFLASLALYLRSDGFDRYWGFSLACFALALLSKATAVVLPAVLLAYEGPRLLAAGASLQRWRSLGARLVPFGVLAAFYVWWISHIRFLTRSLDQEVRSGIVQFYTQLKAFAYYLYLLAAPVRLNVEHQFFEESGASWWLTALPAALLLSWGALLWFMWRRRFFNALWLNLWSAAVLTPVMVVPLNILVNERRLYMVVAALCLGLAMARPPRLLAAGARRGLLVAALVAVAALTWERNSVWADGFSLWGDSVAKAPRMPRPHLYLGNVHVGVAGRTPDPEAADFHWKEALRAYQEVVRWDQKRELAMRAINNVGSIHFVLGYYDIADKAFRRALEENPAYADALVGVGNVYQVRARQANDREEGRNFMREAARQYETAIQLSPNHFQAHCNLGLMYAGLDEYDKAETAYRRAVFLNPNDGLVLSNLASLFKARGQLEAQKGADPSGQLNEAARLYRLSLQASQTTNHSQQLARDGLQEVEGILQALQQRRSSPAGR